MNLTGVEKGFVAVFVVVLFLFVLSAAETVKKRKAFMAECQKDKKAYECEVLVKQAHPGPNVVWVIH